MELFFGQPEWVSTKQLVLTRVCVDFQSAWMLKETAFIFSDIDVVEVAKILLMTFIYATERQGIFHKKGTGPSTRKKG